MTRDPEETMTDDLFTDDDTANAEDRMRQEAGSAPDPAPDLREALEAAMNEAYTYEDRDNSVPTLPFIDDLEGFWHPFAAKVAAVLPARSDAGLANRNPVTTLVGDLAQAIARTLEDQTATMDRFTTYLDEVLVIWQANAAGDDHALSVAAEVESIRLYWTNLRAALPARSDAGLAARLNERLPVVDTPTTSETGIPITIAVHFGTRADLIDSIVEIAALVRVTREEKR